jgi:hypothetical protein
MCVGAPGIEPGTSCTPCKRASRTAPRPVSLSLHFHFCREQGGIIAAITISDNELWRNSRADRPVLQTFQHLLHQPHFPLAEQVGVDVVKEEWRRHTLPTFARH